MDLTDDDVRAILKLLETSQFGDLELETPEFRLTLHRMDDGGWTRESATLKAAHSLKSGMPHPAELAQAAQGTKATHVTLAAQTAQTAQSAQAASTAQAAPGAPTEDPRWELIDVCTPLPGTFYRAPKPGAPPFVELDAKVGANTVIAIVETMKLMNSVYAGVAGRIAEICLEDASFAAQDAVLMRIDADRP
jgi:acetyl-CoA carboxylase biotin carboxyl carrier protein